MKDDHGFRPTAWARFKRRKGVPLLVLAGFCLLITVFGAVNMSKGVLLEREGRAVMAEVVGTEVTRQIRHNASNNMSTTYRVDLRFETEAGVWVETTQSLPGRLFRDMAEGVATEVIYLPSDPEVLEFEPGQTRQSGRVAAIGGGLGLLLAIAGLAQAVIAVRREG